MQSLTAPPRDQLDPAAITAMLVAEDLSYSAGLDLLDSTDTYVDDLTPYLQKGGYVTRDCNAVVHGSCTFTLDRALAWGADRVRPYVVCGSETVGIDGVRFNLGIYFVTSPSQPIGNTDGVTGERVDSYSVTGYDKLYLVSQPVGDSVLLPQGGAVLLQVANLIAAATNNDPRVNIDQSSASVLLPSDIVYPLDASSPASYLDIVNDLLALVNYQPLWVDQDGYYTSSPQIDPATATPEWLFDVDDNTANLIADPRVRTQDTWGVPNWFRFIRNGLSTQPVEGSGQFTYIDGISPLTGYGALGYYVKKLYSVDAADQQTLQAIAQQQIISDTNVPETWSLPSGPLPHSGHFDVVSYHDDALDDGVTYRKLQVQSWTLQLDGTEMERTAQTVAVLSS